MAQLYVVVGPQPLVCGHREDQRGIGRGYPPELLQRSSVIFHMLQNVTGQHEVESSRVEREHLEPGSAYVAQASRLTEGDGIGGGVDTRSGAEGTELDQVAAGATSGIENVGCRRQLDAVEQRPDDRAPTSKPPVDVLLLVHLRIGEAFHGETVPRQVVPSATCRALAP